MSKKIRIFIGIIAILFFATSSYFLLKPKNKLGIVEKEISIKQADVPKIETLTYKDSAGFSFEYPSLLKVNEVEIDDDSIFSSLELVDNSGKKLIVKVIDTIYNDTDEWREVFEEKNVISKIKKVMFSDIPSIQFIFGVPISLKTVGVENKILYTMDFTKQKDGNYKPTNAMNGWGDNCYQEIADKEVVIE